mgnify:CR=1 FL=1
MFRLQTRHSQQSESSSVRALSPARPVQLVGIGELGAKTRLQNLFSVVHTETTTNRIS